MAKTHWFFFNCFLLTKARLSARPSSSRSQMHQTSSRSSTHKSSASPSTRSLFTWLGSTHPATRVDSATWRFPSWLTKHGVSRATMACSWKTTALLFGLFIVQCCSAIAHFFFFFFWNRKQRIVYHRSQRRYVLVLCAFHI